MKIIIGIILIYIILVVSSAGLMRYIWDYGEHGETWKSSLTKFGVGYLIFGIIVILIVSILNFCF